MHRRTYSQTITSRAEGQKRILVAEDDIGCFTQIRNICSKAGFHVSMADDILKLAETSARHSIDLAIVSINMAHRDGIALCRELRQLIDAPIVALTENGLTSRQINFLINEADDYLMKPISANELLTRAHLLLRNRRSDRWRKNIVAAGDLILDKVANVVTIDDCVISLTPNESQLLSHMMRKPGETLRKEEIIQAVWHSRFYNDYNVLRVTIRRLRHKIERNPSKPGYLLTVHGVGYTLRTAHQFVA